MSYLWRRLRRLAAFGGVWRRLGGKPRTLWRTYGGVSVVWRRLTAFGWKTEDLVAYLWRRLRHVAAFGGIWVENRGLSGVPMAAFDASEGGV